MSTVKLTPDSGGGSVQLKAPASTSGADVILKLPNTDGNNNQLLKTDGSGNLSWADDTDTTNTNASNLTSGTLPDARFPATLPAVSGANLTGISSPGSFRNLLDNGAMRVNQRGTVVNAGNEYGGPDRWKFMKNDGAFTVSQDTDVPTGQGFANSYKIDCTSVASTSGVYYVHLLQYIEGQDLQRVKKGTSNAEQLTISFWIKSTKTGTYVAELYDQDNTRHTSKSYTVNTTNTWEKKTITFAADTTGAFGNDNQASLRVILWFYAGSSFQGGTLAGTWAANVSANRAEGQVNAFDNTANNVFVTGIQLETGATATDYEHRSYGDEVARCQRYFQVWSGETPGNFAGRWNGTSNFVYGVPLITPLRASPSVECKANDTSGSGNGEWKVFRTDGASTSTNVPTVRTFKENSPIILMNLDGLSGGTDDRCGTIQGTLSASGFFRLSAEL